LIEKLFTIGVYGKSETQFFDQLEKAGVKTLCDIRLRRAVRGSQYAFANSQRLQSLWRHEASPTGTFPSWLRLARLSKPSTRSTGNRATRCEHV